jgi:3-methyladenine DNA glycosylase AlkD
LEMSEKVCDAALRRLKAMAHPERVKGMARFGISEENTLGVSMPELRSLARELGKSHALAIALWDSGIHEARILAGLVDVSAMVDEEQMDAWVEDFDSWDVCDQVVMSLFDRTQWAYAKAAEWSRREEQFVRRAGFAMMASLAVHDKKAPDAKMLTFLPLIEKGATDERNFVKKAVNWALRQIGKRNVALNVEAIRAARKIQKLDSRSARWIAADALRELVGPAVQRRLKAKG